MAKKQQIIVKKAPKTQDFLEKVQILDARIFSGDDPIFLDGKEIWVVFVDGNLAAFGVGYLEEDRKTFYLDRTGVLPKYRGLGIQRRLIKKMVGHASSIGCKYATGITVTCNTYSSNNLIKCGFLLYWPTRKSDCFNYWRKKLLRKISKSI